MTSLRYTRWLYVAFASIMLAVGFSMIATRTVSANHTPAGTYRNDPGTGVYMTMPDGRRVQSFADPSVIRGKDGFYYAYGTSDPLFEGDREHLIPMARSNDLVHWTYVGDAFASRPATAEPSSGIWAPDIRYMNGLYYLYYGITNSSLEARDDDSAIGVATSVNPTGPWTDRGTVVAPSPAPCCGPESRRAQFDMAVFTDLNGQRYIYYGSYFGGIAARKLSQDGLRSDPASQTQITIANRYEAPYVKRHGDFYYLFVSATNCCALELSGYTVFAGRSRSPLGPFVDREGVSLLPDPTPPYDCSDDATPPCNTRVGGTPVLSMNGNRWVGPGHNAVLTDVSGQDWAFYHAIDRFDPALRRAPDADNPQGLIINQRPMLMDRLDWINGWPTVRADYWASADLQRAPVTTGSVYDEFNRTTIGTGWIPLRGSWRIFDPVGSNRGAVRQSWPGVPLATLLSRGTSTASYRAEADLKLVSVPGATAQQSGPSRYGLLTSYRDSNNYIAVWLQPGANGMGGKLITNLRMGGSNSLLSSALPATFNHKLFHNVAVELRGRTLTVKVSESRLQDYLAVQTRTIAASTQQQVAVLGAGRVGLVTQYASADFDNVSAARLYIPITQRRPYQSAGTLNAALSDEFTDECSTGTLDKYAFTDPANPAVGTPAPDTYGFQNRSGNCWMRWRVQQGDLAGANDASVLASKLPIVGDFTLETRVQLTYQAPSPAIGFNPVYGRCCFNYQQAGIVAYQNDDRYVRLTHVSIWDTRQTEFGKEQETPTAYGARYGNTVVGPPGNYTTLRIVRRGGTYTAYTKQDGKPWIRGGTWTHNLTTVRAAITAMGAGGPVSDPNLRFTAYFDYIRVYQP